jgi:microcystin-dependent protein
MMALGSFTDKADYTFKHTSQTDEPAFVSPTVCKTNLDSQAVELRTYLNSTLIPELQGNSSAATSGANKIGIKSTFGNNVQAAIDTIESAGSGSIPPDDSLTTAKFNSAAFSTDGTMADNSDTKVASQKSIKTYVDGIAGTGRTTETLMNIAGTGRTTETIKSAYDLAAAAYVPAGTVIFYAKNSAPTGYLKANGAAISRTTYSALFSAIGTTFGVGDGSTTFNVPDMRGLFPRGWVDDGTYDSGRGFGSYQADDVKAHGHTFTTNSDGGHTHQYSMGADSGYGVSHPGSGSNLEGYSTQNVGSAGAHTHTGTTDNNGTATETIVKNAALLACIKY